MTAAESQARALALQVAAHVSNDPDAVLASAARYLAFLYQNETEQGPAFSAEAEISDEPGWTKR